MDRCVMIAAASALAQRAWVVTMAKTLSIQYKMEIVETFSKYIIRKRDAVQAEMLQDAALAGAPWRIRAAKIFNDRAEAANGKTKAALLAGISGFDDDQLDCFHRYLAGDWTCRRWAWLLCSHR